MANVGDLIKSKGSLDYHLGRAGQEGEEAPGGHGGDESLTEEAGGGEQDRHGQDLHP